MVAESLIEPKFCAEFEEAWRSFTFSRTYKTVYSCGSLPLRTGSRLGIQEPGLRKAERNIRGCPYFNLLKNVSRVLIHPAGHSDLANTDVPIPNETLTQICVPHASLCLDVCSLAEKADKGRAPEQRKDW